MLVTGHRRESFGDGFERICRALAAVADRPDTQVVYPVHLNANVKDVVTARLGKHPSIHLLEPVEYAEMVYLMKRAALLLTDSGGIQEEAPSLGKPVLVMRDVTERPEAIATGVAQLVGTDPERIVGMVAGLLDDPEEYRRRARVVLPYGDGKASARIADAVETFLTARRLAA